MNLFTNWKQAHRHRKQTYGYQRGEGKEINQEFGISRYKLLYIKQINNKVLLYSTGNYIQYPVIHHNEKQYVKEYILNHLAVHEKLTHCKSAILQLKKNEKQYASQVLRVPYCDLTCTQQAQSSADSFEWEET